MDHENARPIRVLVVDDHPVLRDGVVSMLESAAGFAVAGEASSGEEAVEKFRTLTPDVTLMDLQMPGMDGLETIAAIRSEFPGARIVVLTTYEGDVQAMRALKAGALGYLLKSSPGVELLAAIRDAYVGRRHLHRDVANEIALHALDDNLTEREIAALVLVSRGKANKHIARELGVSEETIKAHLKNIFAKLDVSDRTEAVTVAVRRGFIRL